MPEFKEGFLNFLYFFFIRAKPHFCGDPLHRYPPLRIFGYRVSYAVIAFFINISPVNILPAQMRV